MLWVLLFLARGDSLQAADDKFLVAQPVMLHAAPPRDGTLVLPAGSYRAMWGDGAVVFFRADDMRDVGRLVGAQSDLKKTKPQGATIKVEKGKVTLTIIVGRKQVIISGEQTAASPAAAAEVRLADSAPASVPTNLPGADDPVVQSWLRLKSQIAHCAEHAERSGWNASDEKYQRCVCPLALAFRMPGINATRRFALDRRADVSLAIDAAGKITACRVAPPVTP